ncbi:hypothetical protein CP967_00970 [Streptomyces nitrosporeus]|uniref:Uncharacterized protein n=1 Tax=Streptomyces nitrosporeus TaxID=28894 RepID=A0A5J6F300_9ACTN|nr:hypothetical protein CP967_00970 [Streptomyces nitrosporeus]
MSGRCGCGAVPPQGEHEGREALFLVRASRTDQLRQTLRGVPDGGRQAGGFDFRRAGEAEPAQPACEATGCEFQSNSREFASTAKTRAAASFPQAGHWLSVWNSALPRLTATTTSPSSPISSTAPWTAPSGRSAKRVLNSCRHGEGAVEGVGRAEVDESEQCLLETAGPGSAGVACRTGLVQ